MKDGFQNIPESNNPQLSWVYCFTEPKNVPPEYSSRLCLMQKREKLIPLVCTYIPDITGEVGCSYWVPKGLGRDVKRVFPYAWLAIDTEQLDAGLMQLLREKTIVGFTYDGKTNQFILKE